MEIPMESWTETVAFTVDQRHYRLGPTWVLRKREPPDQGELGSAVHISGKNGKLTERVTALLASARQKAVVSSYLIADREVDAAILEAAKRGVRVYVMLASEARLDGEPGGEFEQRMLDEHKDMLGRLGGYVLIRSAPHFHAKLVLVDPEASPAGMLLTANLTTEALGRNEELAIVMRPDEVKEAAELLRWAMWEDAEHELVDPGNFRAVMPLGCVAHPSPSPHVLATTSSAKQLREEAVDLIDSASGELIVASFGWAADHPVVERLCARAREGVALTVLARVRERAMPALVALAEAGARVLGFKWLHAKALWADSERALVMSANLEPKGLDKGFELGLRLQNERTGEVRTRLEMWADRADWELCLKPAFGELTGAVRVWQEGKLVDLDVKSRRTVDLGSVTAASAHDLKAPPKKLPRMNGLPAHGLECRWRVRPPQLHPKAEEVMRPASGEKEKLTPYTPRLFKEPDGKRVVAVESQGEIPAALQVAAETGAVRIVVRAQARS